MELTTIGWDSEGKSGADLELIQSLGHTGACIARERVNSAHVEHWSGEEGGYDAGIKVAGGGCAVLHLGQQRSASTRASGGGNTPS